MPADISIYRGEDLEFGILITDDQHPLGAITARSQVRPASDLSQLIADLAVSVTPVANDDKKAVLTFTAPGSKTATWRPEGDAWPLHLVTDAAVFIDGKLRYTRKLTIDVDRTVTDPSEAT